MPIPTPPRRWPKLLIGALAVLALLLAVAYAALRLAFPPERLAALLSAQLSAATGRSFAVSGPLSIHLLPQLGIAAADVALGNAPWGTRKDMLRVRQARFNVALLPLLRGRVELASASLDGVDLWLETDRHGVGNWVMGPAQRDTPPARPQGEPPSTYSLQLDHLALHDAQLSYRDGRSGDRRSLQVDSLRLDSEGRTQRLDARFGSGTQRLQLAGQIGRLDALAANDADWPFELRLSGEGLDASAKGQLRRGSLPRPLEADVALRLTRTETLVPWVGPVPALPLPVQAKGRLSLAGSALRVDALQLSLAQQTLSGKLAAWRGTPWKLDAQLSAGAIDLKRWLPPRGASAPGPAAPQRQVFGSTPLGLDALPALQATLGLRVEQMLVPGLPPLSTLNLQLKLQPGRVRVEPLSFGVAGGNFGGSLGLSQSGTAPPRVALRAQASKLSLDELLRAAGSSDYARGGQLQLRADLDMAGNTPRALAAGANGELTLTLHDATLGQGVSPLGTDMLRRLLQALTLRPDLELSSHIDCAVIRLPLKNGVAAIDRSIALETDQLAVSAKGEVRLDDETLALAFAPTPKQGLKISPLDLTQLVVLKGPWRDPKVQLDAQGLLGVAASLGQAGASGGVSAMARQLLQARPESGACRAALSGRGSPAAAATPTPPARPASSASPASLPQALPEALRRLFR